MKRRDFVAGVGMGSLATGLAACSKADTTTNCGPGASDGKTWKWNMVTSWPPLFPGLGTGADYLARSIEAASGGRIDLVHTGVADCDYEGVNEGWGKFYWEPWRAFLEAR